MNGDTCGVNLSESEVGQVCAFLEGLYGGRAVAAHGVGRQEECTAITTGGKYYGMSGVAFDFAGDEVTHDDTAGAAVDDNYIEHLAAHEALHCALLNLAVERRVCAQQQLLAGLTLWRRMYAIPGHRQTSGWPADRRIRGQRVRPVPHTGQ